MLTSNYGVRLYSLSHTHPLKNISPFETCVQNGNPFSKLFMTDDTTMWQKFLNE